MEKEIRFKNKKDALNRLQHWHNFKSLCKVLNHVAIPTFSTDIPVFCIIINFAG